MTDFRFIIGPLSIRRRLAVVVAVIGVAFVGSRLAHVWPRDVEVVYDVGPETLGLDVDYLQGGEAAASVRFTRSTAKVPIFRHVVRLQPGGYQIHITRYGLDGSAEEQTRRIAVPAPSVTRVDLRAATGSSE
jgi:hypothetical protein